MDDFQKEFFGFSEIEKIQEDIEKNLSGELTPKPAPPREDFANFFLVPQEEIPAENAADFFREEITETDTDSNAFYREMIKPAPKKSWAKVAVILFFVCTVGTGMLGLGIGAGWGFVRGNAAAASGEANIGEREAIPESVRFTGTSYVFEAVTEEPAVASISDMVALLAPSVVGITTYRDERIIPDARFFSPMSYGSGIIFASTDDRIFIATNLYVVRAGYRWEVSIEGSEPIAAFPVGMPGELVSLASAHDLTVAYIYKEQLLAAGIDSVAFATFGDSDEMRIGEVVLAIGNAMGEGTSVTRGIISAGERPVYLPGRNYPITVLQTDAAINYGNSGGPLINTRGEIIGININQAADFIIGSSQAEGMGYSISSNLAAPILREIVASYRTPAIGITGFSLANDRYNRAEYWGIPELGVLVYGVQEGRPAHLAGIQAEDVITAFDGQPIFDMPQLQAAIRSREIGDVVEIRLLRGGSFALTVQVELEMMVRDTF